MSSRQRRQANAFPFSVAARALAVALLAWGPRSVEAGPTASAPDLTELPLEALMEIEVPKVFGASKIEQKTTEAPSSVTVITADDIKRFGYRTLADVLQSTHGFYVTDDRNYSYLGVRGVSLGDFNSRILLLVDGHRVNNNLTGGAYIGPEFILDLELVDRVEIIRGPGSALYGNNAFFAVINVITRKGRQINGAEASGEYGSYDTYKGRFTVGKLFTNGVDVLLSGTYFDSTGEESLYFKVYDTPDQNNGVAKNLDGQWLASFFGSVGYKDFVLEGAYGKREKDNPTAQYLTTFNDPKLRTMDERSYAALKFTHSLPADVDVTAQVYYDSVYYDITYPVGNPVQIASYQEEQTGEWWGTEVQVNKRLWDRHTLTLGAEYRDDFRQQQQVFDDTTTYTDNHRNEKSYGLYAQGEFTLRTNLHFNGGVRYDHYADFAPSVNPRLALIYNPFKDSTIKLLYGTAYRAPNFLELSDPRYQDVKPEEITSYEVVYEQGLGKNLRSSVSAFWNDMYDLIVLQNGAFTNFDARTKGVEVALDGNWNNGLRTRLSYSLQNTENRSAGGDIPNSPAQLVKANISVPLIREKVFAGLEYQYTSCRQTEYTTTTGQTVHGEDLPGYGVLNSTLFSQNLIKNLQFSASVYNVLDCKYEFPSSRFHLQDSIPADGRTFLLKLTYRF